MPVLTRLLKTAEEGGISGVLRIIRVIFLEEVLEAVFVGGDSLTMVH